jgi:hypothetical protein
MGGCRGIRRNAVAGTVVAALVAVLPGSAAANPPLSPLGKALDSLPNPPQFGDLPGANAIPDLSHVPGGPEVQGVITSGAPPITDSSVGGLFGSPFAEPGPACPHETQGSPAGTQIRADITCKPTAVSIVMLPNGKLLYWDGLEAQEHVKYTDALEISDRAVDDQSRLLTLNTSNPSASTWTQPFPVDGGANGTSNNQYLLNVPPPFDQIFNDPGNAPGALFCSSQVFLANGDVLVPGGTWYYSEPHLPGTNFGLIELQGLQNTRIYHTATNTWSESGPMQFGRWYPSLVTLADGKVFVASGVTKLIKPIYSRAPLMSGHNVVQTETYDPNAGTWSSNGPSADRQLPLYPRIHLLPDGNVYYDAGGQVFNPFGEAYDEALWNIAAVYNPVKRDWRNVGIPFGVSLDPSRPLDTSITAGFRGSAFSVMLPLRPPYTKATFLSAGGVLGTTPGAYLANASSVINTIDTAHGDAFSSHPTAPLHNARWFGTAVELPTEQVIVFNGANRDEVVLPGINFPTKEAELFDPATDRWTRLATGHYARTYHNTAILLPTGQVLVGGHAPIATLDGYNQNLPGGFAPNFRNPSFEIYDPPYLHWGIAQPQIAHAPGTIGYGGTFSIQTPDAASIKSIVLVRNTAITHIVDGDQREVELPIMSREGNTLTVADPPGVPDPHPSSAVAPPGPYMLFINKSTPKGLVPSHAAQVFVG